MEDGHLENNDVRITRTVNEDPESSRNGQEQPDDTRRQENIAGRMDTD